MLEFSLKRIKLTVVLEFPLKKRRENQTHYRAGISINTCAHQCWLSSPFLAFFFFSSHVDLLCSASGIFSTDCQSGLLGNSFLANFLSNRSIAERRKTRRPSRLLFCGRRRNLALASRSRTGTGRGRRLLFHGV